MKTYSITLADGTRRQICENSAAKARAQLIREGVTSLIVMCRTIKHSKGPLTRAKATYTTPNLHLGPEDAALLWHAQQVTGHSITDILKRLIRTLPKPTDKF